uniref:Uncharacterized protein n=1 Tax=Arundo donax TaxID=35708 RepID=A0A0A9DRU8_ARUDO
MEILDTPHHREETSLENAAHVEVQRFSDDDVPRDSLEGQHNSTSECTDCSDITLESDDSQYLTAHTAINPEAHPSPSINREELKSVVVDWTEPMPKACTATKVEDSTAENIKVKNATEKAVEVESDVRTDKDTEASHNFEFKKSDGDKTPSFTFDAPSGGKDTHSANFSGSFSRPSAVYMLLAVLA